MADGHGFFLEKRGAYSIRDGDLQEEDVWAAVVKERSEDLISPEVRRARPNSSGSSPASSWALSAPPRVIPRGFSAASHGQTKMAQQQSSAPLEIPDWSKIYNRKNPRKLGPSKGGPWGTTDNGDVTTYHLDGDDEDGDGDDDGEMLPPHEYIARRLARSQIPSFSMCEGVGRTLKGRDLSKVRNAILTKTGFLE